MNKRVVLTFANSSLYIHCARRMKGVLSRYSGYDVKHWINTLPPGSPTHKEQPYAFKAYAFKWARDNGYTSALWLDSAVWPSDDVSTVFEEIEKEGHWICLNGGWSQGVWSTDEQLDYFNVTREQAFNMQHPMACVIGFSFDHEVGGKAFDMYLKAAQDGMFNGPWKNINSEVSTDERVLGSRHDQTCLGFIVNKLGIKYRGEVVEYANINTPPQKNVPFYTCGGRLKYEV